MQKKNVLVVTHRDLDGVCSAIAVKKVFEDENVDIIAGTYKNIDTKLENVLAKKTYDKIFITDISITEERFTEFLHQNESVHIIDHHPRESDSIIENNYLTISEGAACLMTRKYLEEKFPFRFVDKWNKGMDELVKYGNDYDMWIHDYQLSKYLNRLFYWYSFNKFLNRFCDGMVPLNWDEKEFLRMNNNLLKNILLNLEYVNPIPEVAVTYSSNFAIDEIADYLGKKKEETDTVFIYNTKSKSLSLRGTYEGIHYGDFMKRHGGGGHEYAAATRLDSSDKVSVVIRDYVQQRAV